MPELRLRNLTLGYDRHPAVHHLDGALETGALLAVVGPNGQRFLSPDLPATGLMRLFGR